MIQGLAYVGLFTAPRYAEPAGTATASGHYGTTTPLIVAPRPA